MTSVTALGHSSALRTLTPVSPTLPETDQGTTTVTVDDPHHHDEGLHLHLVEVTIATEMDVMLDETAGEIGTTIDDDLSRLDETRRMTGGALRLLLVLVQLAERRRGTGTSRRTERIGMRTGMGGMSRNVRSFTQVYAHRSMQSCRAREI